MTTEILDFHDKGSEEIKTRNMIQMGVMKYAENTRGITEMEWADTYSEYFALLYSDALVK